MIKKTKWSPDTCKCEVEYSWDNSLPVSEIAITQSGVLKKCEFHQNINDNGLFEVLKTENKSKNNLYENLLRNAPSNSVEVVKNEEGEDITVFNKGKEPHLYFDEERKLHASLSFEVTNISEITENIKEVDVLID